MSHKNLKAAPSLKWAKQIADTPGENSKNAINPGL